MNPVLVRVSSAPNNKLEFDETETVGDFYAPDSPQKQQPRRGGDDSDVAASVPEKVKSLMMIDDISDGEGRVDDDELVNNAVEEDEEPVIDLAEIRAQLLKEQGSSSSEEEEDDEEEDEVEEGIKELL